MSVVVHSEVMENTTHLQMGKKNRVAFVFSCPGRHEESAGYPAAKGTGRNLDLLLSLLAAALGRTDLARENVTITNAWPFVEYKAKTGRTEATEREITSPENVARLQRELQDVTDFVIFCGTRPKLVSGYLKLSHRPRFVFVRHLGLRGLSTICTDVDGERIVAAAFGEVAEGGGARSRREIQCRNTRKRLEVLVRSIVEQLRAHDAA